VHVSTAGHRVGVAGAVNTQPELATPSDCMPMAQTMRFLEEHGQGISAIAIAAIAKVRAQSVRPGSGRLFVPVHTLNSRQKQQCKPAWELKLSPQMRCGSGN